MAPPIHALSINPESPRFWIVAKNFPTKISASNLEATTPWCKSIPPFGATPGKGFFWSLPTATSQHSSRLLDFESVRVAFARFQFGDRKTYGSGAEATESDASNASIRSIVWLSAGRLSPCKPYRFGRKTRVGSRLGGHIGGQFKTSSG